MGKDFLTAEEFLAIAEEQWREANRIGESGDDLAAAHAMLQVARGRLERKNARRVVGEMADVAEFIGSKTERVINLLTVSANELAHAAYQSDDMGDPSTWAAIARAIEEELGYPVVNPDWREVLRG